MEKSTIFSKICFWILILFFGNFSFAQDEDDIAVIERTNIKDTVYVGAFVNSFYDFDIAERSFKTDLWLWFLYTREGLDLSDKIEIANTKDYSINNVSLDKTKGFQWLGMRLKAEVMKDWDVRNYPFDKQSLDVVIESQEFDTSAITLLADSKNSSIDEQFHFKDWVLNKFKLTNFYRIYNTSFGDQELTGKSVYPAIKLNIEITRKYSWLILFKLITGVIIAFMIASSVFFINPLNTDPRFGLCVGGLFAAVGNKYIVEGTIPATTSNTLLDNIHNTTFIFIFIIIVLSIISLKMREIDTEKSVLRSQKIDKIGFFACATIYFSLICSFIYYAY